MSKPNVHLQKKREAKSLKRKKQKAIKRYIRFVAKNALDYQNLYIKFRVLSEQLQKENRAFISKNNKLIRHWNLLKSRHNGFVKLLLRLFQ